MQLPTGRHLRWTAASLAGVVGLLALWSFRSTGHKSDVRFDTVKADRGAIVAQVTANGTLSAIVTVQVGSQVSGRVAQIFVDFNSPVKKGQVVAKIDPQLFEASLEQAKANAVAADGNLAKAKAQALDARRQYERSKQLMASQLVAQADLDTAQANADAADASVKAAEGAVAQAKAGLYQAQVNLDYTTIISPTNGVVISRNVDVGQTVAASLQAPTLFVIAEDLSKMQVDTSVSESDVGHLQAGKPASFTVDAYPTEVFKGTVRQIRKSPQTVQNVVTYDAVIDVSNQDQKLLPGMTANCTFVYAQKDNVLRVPQAAIRFRPTAEFFSRYGTGKSRPPNEAKGKPATPPGEDVIDRRTLWVLRNGVPSALRVRAGISDGSLTEILEGDLKEGDELVAAVSGLQAPSSAAAPGTRRLF